MEGELERYENGGYRGQHSRCCVTLWENHHRGGDKYTRRAAGYHKAGNKLRETNGQQELVKVQVNG